MARTLSQASLPSSSDKINHSSTQDNKIIAISNKRNTLFSSAESFVIELFTNNEPREDKITLVPQRLTSNEEVIPVVRRIISQNHLPPVPNFLNAEFGKNDVLSRNNEERIVDNNFVCLQ